jgi:hypothetical protein
VASLLRRPAFESERYVTLRPHPTAPPRPRERPTPLCVGYALSPLGTQWAKQRHDELDEGEIDAILAALCVHARANDQARKGLDYVMHNRDRMRYPEFHAQGLCTFIGVVEAGCKVAIGARLKRAGMHWTVAEADAIIALRCCKLGGAFEDFWERRSAAAAGAR